MRISDWSSDVCSSDLQANNPAAVARVILELSDLGRPPNRLVIGHQALERAEAALETRRDLYRSHADLGRHTATGGSRLTGRAPFTRPFRGSAGAARTDRKSTRLNSSHLCASRMPTSA